MVGKACSRTPSGRISPCRRTDRQLPSQKRKSPGRSRGDCVACGCSWRRRV